MYASTSTSKNEHSENFERQGSLRKVIPADSNKGILYERQNEELDKLYRMYRQEYIVLAEYKMIQCENIKGVYVIPSKENALVWFGVIFVRNGIFGDGIFRFSIFLHENFPDANHPKVVFQSKIFHPVIDLNSRELYLLKAFPTWNKTDQHLWQVLKYIQWIFNQVEASIDHAINMEAVKMFKRDPDIFKLKVAESVKLSNEHLYDDPPTEDIHYIMFESYSPEVHDKVKFSMLSTGENKPTKLGLSWVLPGSDNSLTRPPTPPSESES